MDKERRDNADPERVADVVEEAGDNAEEVAREVTDNIQESHEAIHEGEQQVENAVHEESQEAAETLGHPELADAIAERIYTRLHADGLLPHTQHHSVSPVSEAGEVVTEATETATEVPSEATKAAGEATQEATQEVAPEQTHWYFRPRMRRRGR